jgi:hypothetical protein
MKRARAPPRPRDEYRVGEVTRVNAVGPETYNLSVEWSETALNPASARENYEVYGVDLRKSQDIPSSIFGKVSCKKGTKIQRKRTYTLYDWDKRKWTPLDTFKCLK